MLTVLDAWHDHRGPCPRSLVSLALAYGQGDHSAGEVSRLLLSSEAVQHEVAHRVPARSTVVTEQQRWAPQEVVSFSLGPLARVRSSVRQLSFMTSDAYRGTFIKSTEAIKQLLEPEVSSPGCPLAVQAGLNVSGGDAIGAGRLSPLGSQSVASEPAGHGDHLHGPPLLPREPHALQHLRPSRVDHERRPAAGTDAGHVQGGCGEALLPQKPAVVTPLGHRLCDERALPCQRKVGFTVEQRAVLWRIWDDRSWRLKEMEHSRARLQAHLVQLLRSLQLSERAAEESANYSDLLDAGGARRPEQ